MSTWLHIGTSPSVTSTLPQARREWEFDYTITTNSGLGLEPQPDVYLAVDQVGTKRYEQQIRQAQVHGTRLVTLDREPLSREATKTDYFDEFLSLPQEWEPFDGRSMTKYRFSGPTCLQYAVINGASTVILVGCDGYTGGEDYYNGWNPHAQHTAAYRTHQVLAVGLRNVAESCPNVQFVQYGNPLYDVGFPNWEVR